VSALDQTLLALADRTRRGTVDLLRKRPRRAGELAAALSISPAALSRHLRVLRNSGLVAEDGVPGDARVRVYRLRRERFSGLRHWLEELDASWAGELQAFKEHVERARGVGARGRDGAKQG
jgi:DNA-binding transcriptional ArsR family regulator